MTNTDCLHHNLMVTSGLVRCSDCLDFLPEHEDNDHRPGLVAENQAR